MTMTTTVDTTQGSPDVVPYGDQAAQRYREAGVWGDSTIAQEFHRVAQEHPQNIAVVSPDRSIDYAELDRLTDVLAYGISELGLAPGGTVLLQLTNRWTTVVAWYGLLKAGLVPISTLPQHGSHEILTIGRQAGAVAHIIEQDFASNGLAGIAAQFAAIAPGTKLITVGTGANDTAGAVSLESLASAPVPGSVARTRVEQIQERIDPGDVAVLQLSGGTTSTPKLIPRLHHEYWYNSRAWADATGMTSGSTSLHLLPVVHNAGIVCSLHAAHAVGATFATSIPNSDAFATVASVVPITHMLMTRPIAQIIEGRPDLRASLRSLELLVWADRAVPAEILAEYESDRTRVSQMFGMGEGLCLVVDREEPAELRHGTQGTPISEFDEVRVLEPGTEKEVEPGTRGELCARGPYTIRGYFRSPERNAEAFTSDGFYRTGDIVVEVRHQGRSYFKLEDRIKDVINRGGEKINAEEVEELLLKHPAIVRAAVVAMPDPRLRERSCAFILTAAGAAVPTVEDIREHMAALGVAKFKWPERIEHRESLPLTNIHKVNKVVLRAEIASIIEAETGSSD